MPNSRNRNRVKSITTSVNRIICQETTIHLSDEKLKNLLKCIYEKARKDADHFKLYKYYNVFLSVAFTLLMSLITADFKKLFNIEAETITNIAWGLFVLCLFVGLILVLFNISKRHSSETQERDNAVKDVLADIWKNGVGEDQKHYQFNPITGSEQPADNHNLQ